MFPKFSFLKDWNSLPEDDLNYISSASAAVLLQTPKGGRMLLWAVVCCVLFFVVWAAVAEVDEFTRGEGKVIPSQYIQVIQNLEGGILAELYVREGEKVHRGQSLVRIDDKRFLSSLREVDVTLAQLQMKAKRLRSEADGVVFTVPNDSIVDPSIISQELAFYKSRERELSSNREVISQQMNQKHQELSELTARSYQLRTSYELVQRELALTEPLVKEGAVSQVELLRLERQVSDLYGELEAAELAIPRVKSGLEEWREKLLNVDLVFRRDAREQLNEINLELSRLSESTGALADRVDRTLVTSPVAGTVKQLLVKTIGGVIQPGMDIAEIVPSEQIMLVEAQIRPADIAYLHPGQNAKVKFTAYDFAIFGGLDGQVVHISPDTIMDEEGNSFYLVRVETSRSFSAPDGAELPIIPGMTVSVDILTGKKTILDYVLKPILKTKYLALRER